MQFEPVKDRIIHVDFLRLGKDARIAVDIPVHFKNHEASPGLKAGGALNVVSHSINIYCPADFIPDDIVVDLTGMQIGQNIHLSQIKLPERVTAVSRDDLTICSISAQAKEEEVAVEAAPVDVPATAQKAPVAAPGAAGAAAPAKGAAAPAKGAAPAAAAAPAAPKKK